MRITDEEGRLRLTNGQVNGMSLYEHGKEWKERREEEGRRQGAQGEPTSGRRLGGMEGTQRTKARTSVSNTRRSE